MSGDQLPKQRVIGDFSAFERGQRSRDALADSGDQLVGRGVREGHDEHLVDACDRALEQRAQHQTHKGVGLAGAGAGLDQMDAR